MWLIVGTSPQLPMGQMTCGNYKVKQNKLVLKQGITLNIERGTEVLAAVASLVCTYLKTPLPTLHWACDYGDGQGSKTVYSHLVDNLNSLCPNGITFHYLFPDVDWHNKILMAIEELSPSPTLVADAGFMYVAKMSGYADKYHLFTPDVGEMCFLADELAPHPFYTRGFLLQEGANVDSLLKRAIESNNTAKNLIIKGHVDYIVCNNSIISKISEPSVATMEAIGGTGDMVTGLATGLLSSGFTMSEACTIATKTNRIIAEMANPTPATSVHELLNFLEPALQFALAN